MRFGWPALRCHDDVVQRSVQLLESAGALLVCNATQQLVVFFGGRFLRLALMLVLAPLGAAVTLE